MSPFPKINQWRYRKLPEMTASFLSDRALEDPRYYEIRNDILDTIFLTFGTTALRKMMRPNAQIRVIGGDRIAL